ncbi:MAG: hypothetical protein IPM76_27765 [Chloroflexi bacterium]|nr:hypothetical protein [Chloroflexota bacterium]
MMKRFRPTEFEAGRSIAGGSFGRLLGGELGSPGRSRTGWRRRWKTARDDWPRVADTFTTAQPQDAARILAEQPDIEQTLADYVAQLAQQSGLRVGVTAVASPRWPILAKICPSRSSAVIR